MNSEQKVNELENCVTQLEEKATAATAAFIMKDIEKLSESFFLSELKTDLLAIAFNLVTDPGYEKKDAITAILKIIDKHQLG
ncbi:hypothetical protein [Priestia aryabhattai]|uniref:hypothetical protein n=1 Tax=Priestia aryabhattai TaxID=412384 RepID=UPI002E1B02DF|nr:hypothetical protein [Priestia aryabhattai]MED4257733.1 hypothetical protein [Priestia aryabhattai]